ncbi:MAG TPA: hypothetical protein VM925_14620 [Labilithrix sp.]|nr:hypothetical protein [Labilithrix sp.]
MAHGRLNRSGALASLGIAAILAACGDPPATRAEARAPGENLSGAGRRPAEYASDDATWGKFHSKRFQVSVPLPDGREWRIDDHRGPELVAVHAATASRLTLVATQEEELMNRQRCEERARARGWLDKQTLTTVEDQVHIGPAAYDSRVWVALDPTAPNGVEGHVFLFGAFLRRCLLVHLATSVPSAKDEQVLASRLAVGNARIVKAITIDPLRTTDDATVPRDKPEIRR